MFENIARIERDRDLVWLAELDRETRAGEIRIVSEPDSNLILIVGRGKWTSPTITDHFAELEPVFLAKRDRFECTRVLCDIRNQAVQCPDIVEKIRVGIEKLYTPADRLATVAGSSLVKMQLRQQLGRVNAQYFMSIDAAKMWLDAYH